MIKKVLLGIAVIALIIIGILAYIAAPYLRTPVFTVNNSSGEPVEVIAFWREDNKNLGMVYPEKQIIFKLNDEAAIKFKAKYASGKEIISEEIYFTSDTSIQAEVTKTSIKLSYEPRT